MAQGGPLDAFAAAPHAVPMTLFSRILPALALCALAGGEIAAQPLLQAPAEGRTLRLSPDHTWVPQ